MVEIEADMKKAAELLNFEKAMELRDVLKGMEKELELKQGNREYQDQKKEEITKKTTK